MALTTADLQNIARERWGVYRKVYHVAPGIIDVVQPAVTTKGVPGTTQYWYQVIAINATGKTFGDSSNVGARVGTTTTGSAALTSSNANIVTWTAVPGATGYDVLKWSGSAWQSLSLNQAAVTFTDVGGAASAYTVPVANTTSPGNDASDGESWDTAWATGAHAQAVAVRGDLVLFAPGGYAFQDTQVAFADGVLLQGAGRDVSVIQTTFNANPTKAAVRPPSGANVSDLTFDLSVADGQYRLGYGGGLGDAPVIGSNTYRCNILGNSDAVYLATTLPSTMRLTDCYLYSTYDTCNIFRGGIIGNTVKFFNSESLIVGPDLQGQSLSRGLSISASGPTQAGRIEWTGGRLQVITPNASILTIAGGATGGTFPLALTAGGSTQTATITYTTSLTAATIKAALVALSNVGGVNAVVTGSDAGPWTISFAASVGPWSMTTNATSLTGGTPTATLAQVGAGSRNRGAETNGDGYILLKDCQIVTTNPAGTAYDLNNAGGTIMVSNVSYDQAKTSGTITVDDRIGPTLLALASGTAQAGTVNTLTLDASDTSPSGAYVGQSVMLSKNTGAGQTALVTAHAAGIITVVTTYPGGNWIVNPNNTTQYVIPGLNPSVTNSVTNIGDTVTNSPA